MIKHHPPDPGDTSREAQRFSLVQMNPLAIDTTGAQMVAMRTQAHGSLHDNLWNRLWRIIPEEHFIMSQDRCTLHLSAFEIFDKFVRDSIFLLLFRFFCGHQTWHLPVASTLSGYLIPLICQCFYFMDYNL